MLQEKEGFWADIKIVRLHIIRDNLVVGIYVFSNRVCHVWKYAETVCWHNEYSVTDFIVLLIGELFNWQVNISTFALLFSEMVQYCQNRVNTVPELQAKYVSFVYIEFVNLAEASISAIIIERDMISLQFNIE